MDPLLFFVYSQNTLMMDLHTNNVYFRTKAKLVSGIIWELRVKVLAVNKSSKLVGTFTVKNRPSQRNVVP